ncbi:UDP-glycosyltransferase UGT5-like isoform X2 [Aethina tumida]|nr:UDP-glycosyltransferase UGT5-like isoform X2 [Aethina tumida]XP_049819204.1 UDP-glycosyltransferase UGT5-like isoform X2 [Aethina tumida]
MITNHESVGNPTHPIVTPYMLLPSSTKMTFYERLLSVMFNIFVKFHYKYFEIPKCEKIAKQYFGNIPSLWEIERNISLIITNANPIINPVRPNVPAVVQVYGIPMGVAKRLPKDLQYFLDNSTNGVIYCSLGTSIPCSNTSTTEFKKLRQVFDELPYNVLWKCDVSETDESNKILFKKWMPQQSVLKHPNIKVFVTQGGVHSIEESLENGIPMLGLPFFVDQPQNVKKLILEGIGLGANLKTDSVDQIKRQITELIENNKYKKAVLDKRNILMDQPMSGMDKVIWWIEYVLRHKGARHLRSAAADLPFYQYFLLDVIAFFLGAVVFISFITYVVVVYVKRYLQAIKIKKD